MEVFMKKLLLSILTFSLVCCCLLFGSCSLKLGYNGIYKFKRMSVKENGVTVSIEVGSEFEGIKLTEDFMVLEIDKDTATLRVNAQDEAIVGICKWTEGIYDDELYFYLEATGEVLFIAIKEGDTISIDLPASEVGFAGKFVLEK